MNHLKLLQRQSVLEIPQAGNRLKLLEMNRVHGTALVVVTHSPELAARLARRVVLVDGYLEEPGVPAPTSPEALTGS